jgi:hypothetical protein
MFLHYFPILADKLLGVTPRHLWHAELLGINVTFDRSQRSEFWHAPDIQRYINLLWNIKTRHETTVIIVSQGQLYGVYLQKFRSSWLPWQVLGSTGPVLRSTAFFPGTMVLQTGTM